MSMLDRLVLNELVMCLFLGLLPILIYTALCYILPRLHDKRYKGLILICLSVLLGTIIPMLIAIKSYYAYPDAIDGITQIYSLVGVMFCFGIIINVKSFLDMWYGRGWLDKFIPKPKKAAFVGRPYPANKSLLILKAWVYTLFTTFLLLLLGAYVISGVFKVDFYYHESQAILPWFLGVFVLVVIAYATALKRHGQCVACKFNILSPSRTAFEDDKYPGLERLIKSVLFKPTVTCPHCKATYQLRKTKSTEKRQNREIT